MKQNNKTKLFFVDDYAEFLKLSEVGFLKSENFMIETYSTGELCVQNLSHNPDIILLDYSLDSTHQNTMNGIETLDKIKAYNSEIPVIMMSTQDKIEIAINCMHHHAYDYVVKGETAFLRLQKVIASISNHKKMTDKLTWYMSKM